MLCYLNILVSEKNMQFYEISRLQREREREREKIVLEGNGVNLARSDYRLVLFRNHYPE